MLCLVLWGMKALGGDVADAADSFQELILQCQMGLIVTSTDEHLTDIKYKLVYCVMNYSLYSTYLQKLDAAAYM